MRGLCCFGDEVVQSWKQWPRSHVEGMSLLPSVAHILKYGHSELWCVQFSGNTAGLCVGDWPLSAGGSSAAIAYFLSNETTHLRKPCLSPSEAGSH